MAVKKFWWITKIQYVKIFAKFHYFHNIFYANGLQFAKVFSTELPTVLSYSPNFLPPKYLLYGITSLKRKRLILKNWSQYYALIISVCNMFFYWWCIQHYVADYCKGIYDYWIFDVLVQASECPEVIKELTAWLYWITTKFHRNRNRLNV